MVSPMIRFVPPSSTARATVALVTLCALHVACSDDTSRDAGAEDSGATVTDAPADRVDAATDVTEAATDVPADVADAPTDLVDVSLDMPPTDAAPADVSPDVSPDVSTDVAVDATTDATLDAATDVAPDARADAVVEASLDAPPDVAPPDVTPDTASLDTSVDGARPDVATDTGAPTCTAGTECSTGLCLLGRCARYVDESIPVTAVPSPDRCRMRVGVDYPTGAPLRMLTVVAGSTGDTGYESVRTGSTWTQRTLSSNVSRYTTPRFHRMSSGALEVDFVQGTTAYLGPRGSVMQSGFSDYETAYSPTGELMAVVKNQGTGTFSYPYPLRLWRTMGTTWASDLVVSSIGTDGGAALHYRADGTPDVLVFGPTSATLYRKALDVWTAAPVYTGPGTHAGGVIALHDPRGGTHVVFGTRVFTFDLSVGELTLDYLYVASDGSVTRRERLPVGGHGFALLDATLAADGSVYAMAIGPASGGRYPTHVTRVSASGVTSSVVANFETATTSCSIAVAPDNTMYLAAYQGYMRPVLLRTFSL